jgi:hypothetical protein
MCPLQGCSFAPNNLLAFNMTVKSPLEFLIGIQGCVVSHQQLGLAHDKIRVSDKILGSSILFFNLAPNDSNAYLKFDNFAPFLRAMTPL